MKLRLSKRNIQPALKWLLALNFGFSGAVLYFFQFLNNPNLSIGKILFSLLYLSVFFTVATFLLLYTYILPRVAKKDYSPRTQVFWLGGMLLAGLYLVFVIPLQTPSFVTRQSLEIVATGDRNPQAKGNEVRLVGLYQPDGTPINFSEFSTVSNWEVLDGQLVAHQQFPSTLSWYGNGLGDYKLIFIAHPWSGVVKVIWNGNEQTIDLYANPGGPQEIRLSPIDNTPHLFKGLYRILAGSFLGLVLFMLSGYLVTRRLIEQQAQKPVSRWAILWYALPMVLVWTIYLLALWPGLMSPDSLDQWEQIYLGRFFDAHPAFHTITYWLISRLWFSPAAIAFTQILALSLIAAWGLGLLNQVGIPKKITWIACFIFTLIPINALLVITLWKDVTYSICLLVLSILVFIIVISDGVWLEKKFSWILIGFVSALVALYRHNGPAAAFATPLLLALVYRRQKYKLIGALVLAIGLWFGIRGPLFTTLGITPAEKAPGPLRSSLLTQQLAAHIHSGTQLTENEKIFADSIYPIASVWPYSCYTLGPLIWGDKKLDWQVIEENRAKLLKVVVSIAKRNPLVNLKDLICRSSLVWQITQTKDGYMYLTPLLIGEDLKPVYNPKMEGFLSEPYTRSASKSPKLANIFTLEYYYSLKKNALLWRPAIYLYLLLFTFSVLAIRFNKWKLILIMLPVLIHSAFLVIVNNAQDFRYQYPVVLVYLIFWPLIFPIKEFHRK